MDTATAAVLSGEAVVAFANVTMEVLVVLSMGSFLTLVCSGSEDKVGTESRLTLRKVTRRKATGPQWLGGEGTSW